MMVYVVRKGRLKEGQSSRNNGTNARKQKARAKVHINDAHAFGGVLFLY
jgi:hypothetical protein